MKILAIAVAGMFGALSRYFLSGWISSINDTSFPYGTLAVNILGCFFISFTLILLVDKLAIDPLWRIAITVGFLGSFTTFATFEMETLRLFQNGLTWLALGNIFGSVILGLGAALLGFAAAKAI
ncbi:MAG: fluoride efflux transporter CrcB [Clostridiales bacterium]|nr:fluoride efflux transporter CrcB [Clostridiales bacterium]MCF8022086.1 fluoride efflux transporter CrcB [Clostridiales bacterium]